MDGEWWKAETSARRELMVGRIVEGAPELGRESAPSQEGQGCGLTETFGQQSSSSWCRCSLYRAQ